MRDYVLVGVVTPLYVQGYEKRNGTRLRVVVAIVPLNSKLKRHGMCPLLSHPILKQSRAPQTTVNFRLAACSLKNGSAAPYQAEALDKQLKHLGWRSLHAS